MMSKIHLQNYTRMELYIALFLVEKTMHYETILDYQEANLLGKYVIPVEYQTRTLSEIRVDSIIGQAVIVDADSTSYAVLQPNTFERH